MEMNKFSHEQIEIDKIRNKDSNIILSPLAYTVKEIDLYKHNHKNLDSNKIIRL